MELGELETEVLRAVRSLGEASPGEVYRAVRRVRNVAYTSVTTTLYRLVDKGLIAARKASEKRVRYRVKEGRAYRRALSSMVEQLVSAFGAPAVSYLLKGEDASSKATPEALGSEIAMRRKKEQEHD
jgi:predicted transcriptional regulator